MSDLTCPGCGKAMEKGFVPITAYRCTGCGVLRFYAQVADEE